MAEKKKPAKKETPLMNEVSKLGKEVGSAVKSMGHGSELKTAALAALKDLESAAGRFGQAFKKKADTPEAHQVQKQAKKVVQTSIAKVSKATKNYRATLSGGLKKISSELNTLAGKISKK